MKYDKNCIARQCKTLARLKYRLGPRAYICLFLWTSVAIAQKAARPTDGLDGSLISREGVALNSVTGSAYVVDTKKNMVAIIDGKTHTATSVQVGLEPVAIAVNSVTNRIYVANHGSGTVSVIDGASGHLLASVVVGPLPYVVVVNSVTNRIYVSNIYSNQLTTLDGKTNQTTSMKAVSADAMVVDEERNRLYLMGYEGSKLAVLDGATGTLKQVPLGVPHQWGLAIQRTLGTVYVTRIGNADMVALDAKTGSTVATRTGSYPCAVAINATTSRAYVANYADDTVTVIDLKRHVPVATIKVGKQPQALAVDEERNTVYVANRHGDSVTVIDGASNQAIETVSAGQNPYAIAVDAKTGAAFAADSGEPAYTVIEIDRPHSQH